MSWSKKQSVKSVCGLSLGAEEVYNKAFLNFLLFYCSK